MHDVYYYLLEYIYYLLVNILFISKYIIYHSIKILCGQYTKILSENNLIDIYDFVVFSQDTYVLKNKYDFDIFVENNVTAETVHFWPIDPNLSSPVGSPVGSAVGLYFLV